MHHPCTTFCQPLFCLCAPFTCAGFWLPGLVRELSDEEASLAAPSAAFLGHALPAVPVLLAGFLALEGREVVNHELSVGGVWWGGARAVSCDTLLSLTGCFGRAAPRACCMLGHDGCLLRLAGWCSKVAIGHPQAPCNLVPPRYNLCRKWAAATAHSGISRGHNCEALPRHDGRARAHRCQPCA